MRAGARVYQDSSLEKRLRRGGVDEGPPVVWPWTDATAATRAGVQQGLLCSAALSDSYHPGLGCAALRADVLIPQE